MYVVPGNRAGPLYGIAGVKDMFAVEAIATNPLSQSTSLNPESVESWTFNFTAGEAAPVVRCLTLK